MVEISVSRRFYMALWCNWLTRRPLKAKSPGSSPGNATKINDLRITAEAEKSERAKKG